MRAIMYAWIVLLSSFLFLSCASSPFINLDSLKSELNLADFPAQKDYPNDDAVILSEVHDVHAILNEEYHLVTVENTTKLIKLFKNIDNYASIEIPIYNGQTLQSISARTIKPDGSTIELKQEDFHTISGDEQGYIFYSDRKKIKFTFPAIEKNCIIEYHYSVHSNYPFIQDVWEIQSRLPKLENIYTLTVPIILISPESKGGYNWTWRYKSYHFLLDQPSEHQNVTPSQATLDQTVTFFWKESNIAAFEPDPMMPSYDNYLSYVKFAPSEWKTWDDISEWYNKYHFKDQLVITNEISNEAKELTAGCTTEVEKVKKVYAFIQTLRYVAIEIGQGGYTPSEPQKVLERKYGDCKDKSILLISLLRSLGIDAKPALVLTENEGTIDPNFPCWEFNHMIVRAKTSDGAEYWMDPTVNHCPLGEVPYADEGVNALVINDDGTSQFGPIPSSSYKNNLQDITMKVSLASQKEIDYDITIKFQGEENFRARSYLNEMTHDEVVKFCKSLVADNYLDAEVTDYSMSDLNTVDSAFVFNFKLKVPNGIEKQGDLVLLNVDPLRLPGNWNWLARDKRTYDIEFDYPRTVNKTIELNFPKDVYEIRTLPNNIELTQKGLYFSETEHAGENGHVTIKKSFSILWKYFKANHFRELKNFAESMRKASLEDIILTTK
ncbi:MAG: DUF3857 and transglutaminase domain-containing protein [Bacteroidota bacterium]|nr:DUF3857 and transglutaminase domain-containing protein [Bacteroidota bacterium]